MAVPEEWDGAGLDYVSWRWSLEEIAAGDGGTSTIMSVNNCPVGSHPDGLRQRGRRTSGCSPLARGEMLGAFCLTEPQAGSRSRRAAHHGRRDGDHYVLNGIKQFITSGKNGDVAIVMAVTDKAAGKKGISAFIVPTDTPGYIVARIEDKLGQHSSATPRRSCSRTAACRLTT